MRRTALSIALISALSLLVAPTAAALEPPALRVDGGEETWRSGRSFTIRWTNPPGAVATNYRLIGPSGDVVQPTMTLGLPAAAVQLSVPSIPGAYTAEAWHKDSSGAKGPAESVKLLFDDKAPGRVDPLPVAGWLGRSAFPLTLRLGRPDGPTPISGIRGFAISIGRTPAMQPCASPLTCSDAEMDLVGGPEVNALTVADLPEGINHVAAVAVTGSDMRSALPGTAVLRVDKTDPLTKLHGVPSDWTSRPLTLTATATDSASGMAAGVDGVAPYTAIRIDDAAPTVTAGDRVTAQVIGSGVHRIEYFARDAAGNVGDGGRAGGTQNPDPATEWVRIDREPPELAFASAQDPRAPERIEVRVADSLSGVDRSRTSITVREVGSGERFERLPTELFGQTLHASWDSDAYPPGEYEFRAHAHDLAGNQAASMTRSGGRPMRLRSPLKIETRLIAGIDRASAPYGRRVSFSGHLLAGRRAPLAGASVQVVERFDPGATRPRRISTVTTRADGGFDLRLPAGPSREIVATAMPTATLRGASSRPVRLLVGSGVRLRASAPVARVGGRPVVFSGRVAGATLAEGGRVVELQFRLPGLAWSEFRTIRTDARGRFGYRYRFSDDDSRGIRFQFRAFVPAQAGWPFEPAGSPPVTVKGS